MFSASDIREIYRALPPEKGADGQLGDLPALLTSPSEQGFVTTEYAFEKFKQILKKSELKQISIAGISQDLQIEPDAVRRFAKASPSLASLTREKASILPTKQRDFIHLQLQEQLSHQLVSKADFSREHNISLESLDDLAQLISISHAMEDGVTNGEDYIIGKPYERSLTDAIKLRLEESMKDATVIELSSASCPGSPPIWFLAQTLQSVLNESKLNSDFHISQQSNIITCTPKASILRKRDDEIEQLRRGDAPCLDLQKHFDDFREVYTSKEEVEKHLAAYSDIELLAGTALSNAWLSKFGTQCAEALKVLGYADLTSNIKANFPPPYHKELAGRLEKHIISANSEESGDTNLRKAGDYLLTSTRYGTDRSLLLHSATIHASQRWQDLKDDVAKELKFDALEVTAFIPEDQAILRSIAEDPEIKKAVEETYWSEIAKLEKTNEEEFSLFWKDRVVSRSSIYKEGVESIEDAKLNAQLAELLSTYIAKELLPDAIAKARERGLLWSRKTEKNIQKLDTALQKRGDISSADPALEKFNAKQGISELDSTSLQEAKCQLVQVMVTQMQKAKDGPTLFLLLVIVLLAKQFEGIVYATGKFAPKLMKMLKTSLGEEQYEQLEKWKDAAKAGTLSAEDKSAIRTMVGKSTSEALADPETVSQG